MAIYEAHSEYNPLTSYKRISFGLAMKSNDHIKKVIDYIMPLKDSNKSRPSLEHPSCTEINRLQTLCK
jgi:hypothetical protein